MCFRDRYRRIEGKRPAQSTATEKRQRVQAQQLMSQTAEEGEAQGSEIVFRKRGHSHCFTLAKKEHAPHSAQARPTMHSICLVITGDGYVWFKFLRFIWYGFLHSQK